MLRRDERHETPPLYPHERRSEVLAMTLSGSRMESVPARSKVVLRNKLNDVGSLRAGGVISTCW